MLKKAQVNANGSGSKNGRSRGGGGVEGGGGGGGRIEKKRKEGNKKPGMNGRGGREA